VDRQGDNRLIDALRKPFEAFVRNAMEPQTEADQEMPAFGFEVRVGQLAHVRGEQEHALQQRDGKRGNDYQWQRLDNLAHEPADEGERDKRHHVRYNRREDGAAHLHHAVHGRSQGRRAALARVVDRLADNGRVVHDDTEHGYHAEERDHVDGRVGVPHDHECAHDADGHAETDPETEADVEEQPEQNEHESQALQPVSDQQADARLEHRRHAAPYLEVYAGGQVGALALDVFVHRAVDRERVLVFRLADRHRDGRQAVKPRKDLVLDKTVADGGDAVQRDVVAVRPGQHDDTGEFRPRVVPAHGAQADFLAPGPHEPARQVQAVRADGLGHLIECDAVLTQPLFRDFDADFVVARANDLDLRQCGNRPQVPLDLLRVFLQVPLRGVLARQCQKQDLDAQRIFLDNGAFRVGRKGRYGVDRVAHAVFDDAEVLAFLHFDDGKPVILVRDGVVAFNADQAVDRVLDLAADALLNLFRVRPRPYDRDVDHVQVHIGEGFARQVDQGQVTAEKDERQHDVREHPVAREGGDKAPHEARSVLPVDASGAGAAMSTRMPGKGLSRRVTITRSPGCSPSETNASSP